MQQTLHLTYRTYPEISNERNISLGDGLGKVKKVGGARGSAKTERKARDKKSKSSTLGKQAKATKRTTKAAPSNKVARGGAKSPARKEPRQKSTKETAKKSKKPGTAVVVGAPTFTTARLDPIERCGSGTSVQRLYRVDETGNGPRRVHLVFFDRHGWYCEHGRECAAVSHAMQHARKDDPATHHGPTHNGRMRA